MFDLREPVRVGVEPVEIAVEYEFGVLRRRHHFDRGQRGGIAVKPSDDIKSFGLKIRRAGQDRRSIGVILRADAPRAGGLFHLRKSVHSAASFSAPPQLDPWP